MDQTTPPPVVCPDCGTTYKWKPHFAGKELHCRCGCSFIPVAPVEVKRSEELPYSHYVAAVGGGTGSIKKALEERSFDAKPSRVRDIILPGLLLSIGFVIQVGLCLRLAPEIVDGAALTIAVTAGVVALQALILLPIMLITLAVTTRWFDLALGTLGGVTFKAAAIVLGVAGIADIMFMTTMVVSDFDMWVIIAGLGFYVPTCALPLAILFGMGLHESVLVLLLNFLPRVAIVYAFALIWPELFP